MDPRFSRAYGALAGLALGDALGMPTQEMSPEQIRAVYGRITGLVDGDASQPYAPGMPAGSAYPLANKRGCRPGRSRMTRNRLY